jgi:T5SS/PEP-CTERM-associated repeat protein
MLQITNGGAVSTSNGYVGVYGNGNVLVDGTGSHWNTSSIVMDRYTGSSGSLTITNGGAVTSGSVLAGFYVAGASGVIKVDGTGSILTTTGSGGMMVGRTGYGTATMSITDGGAVTGAKISIGSGSLLTTDVSSSLTLGSGTGTLTNAGTVRLVAGAGAGAGTYTPISAGTWTNTGTIQALGGVLNSNNTVTVNAAALTTTSTVANFDLSTTQRVLVTDLASGKSVGAGFQAAPASTPINFGASLVNSGEQSSLQSLLSNGQSVLSAWTFTTSASVSNTNPVYLSLFAGAGHSLNNDLEIWEFNGTSWSSFAANDLAYDGTYASFTTTALEDFAVTGEATPTPIPGALLLFGPGLAGLGLIRKRVFKA